MYWLVSQLGSVIPSSTPVWGQGNVQMSGSISVSSATDFAVSGTMSRLIEAGDQVNLFAFGFYDLDGGHYTSLFLGTYVFVPDDTFVGTYDFLLEAANFPNLNIHFPAGSSNTTLEFFANVTSSDMKSISSVIRRNMATKVRVSKDELKQMSK
jgi:hypothetical protein